MAHQIGNLFHVGTIEDVCFYKIDGQYYVRMKSSLTGDIVKTSRRFRNTMRSAGLLARASKIASAIYAQLPQGWKHFCMYRSFTGEAMYLLKAGRTDKEATQVLWKTYIEQFTISKEVRQQQETELFIHTSECIAPEVISPAADDISIAGLHHRRIAHVYGFSNKSPGARPAYFYTGNIRAA